jgi:uroporphyrinogen III methyltransferase / synthase
MSDYVNTSTPRTTGDTAPLNGLRVLVTRPAEQASDLIARLRALGATPVLCPTIQIAPPESFDSLDRAIAELAAYDWVIFTSVNGVRFFLERLTALGYDAPQSFAGLRIAAIGPATAQALSEQGLVPSFVPARFVAEGILEEIGDVAGQRILLPRADIARKALVEGLRARGAAVDEVTAYRTVAAEADLPVDRVDLITFTSPSTVRNFVALFDSSTRSLADFLTGARVACIGPITAQAARAEGFDVHIEAQEHTVDGLLRVILDNQERGQ